MSCIEAWKAVDTSTWGSVELSLARSSERGSLKRGSFGGGDPSVMDNGMHAGR